MNLVGKISSHNSLYGILSTNIHLGGTLSLPSEPESYPIYHGEVEVAPSANEDVVLKTAGKILEKDIVIAKIPYSEVSNPENGVTIYIAEEVLNNYG